LGVDNLKKLDTAFDELDDATAKLILKIQADLAPAFLTIVDLASKFVDSIGAVRIRVKAKELDMSAYQEGRKKANKAAMEVNPKIFGRFDNPFFDPTKPGPVSDTYYRVLNEESKKIVQKHLPNFLGIDPGEDGGTGGGAFDVNLEKTKLEKLVKQTEHYERILEVGFEQAELEKQIAEFKASASESELERIENGEISIKQLIKQNDEAKKLVDNTKIMEDSYKQMRKTIAIDMGNGIKDLIKGTATLNDIMTNMLNKMADAFLNMAIFGNMGGNSITGGLLGMFKGKADGGPVQGGKPYVVGERGPEVFTPGVSGGITPNHALGGSTSISVNVDASGSSVEGNEQSGEELGRLIAVAIQSELIKEKRPGGLLS